MWDGGIGATLTPVSNLVSVVSCGSMWGLSRCGSGGLGCQRAPGSAVSSTTSVQGVENLIVATTDDEGLCSNHRSGVLPTSLDSPIHERSPSCQPVLRSAVSRVATHPTCVRHAPA